MKTRWSSAAVQWIQWGLFVVGCASLTWCVLVVGEARWFQARRRDALERMLPVTPRVEPREAGAASAGGAPGVIGELDIPRLRLSTIVAEGDDDEILKIAVGHLPDTPLPWEPGNSAFAGHRDTFFRELKDIRLGDVIRLTTEHGEFRYRVERTVVVQPDDLSVLAPSPTPRLTLITCFPFSYVGNAPRRFIVQAQQVEAVPTRRAASVGNMEPASIRPSG